MFGYHEIPFKIEKDEVLIETIKNGNFILYRRNSPENVEKIISGGISGYPKIVICPVEPVNIPKRVTNYLLIELEKPIVVAPDSSININLTFPIEIGVFTLAKKSVEVLDIFSLTKPKYALYGDPKDGVICKYWESKVVEGYEGFDPLKEGILELTITNNGDEWAEVKRVIFDAFSMKIYYSEDVVSMRAFMKIINPNVAETGFVKKPLKNGMRRSIELYTARKLPISEKFLMEWGL